MDLTEKDIQVNINLLRENDSMNKFGLLLLAG